MATPTKQELDQINALLKDIQQKYDQLGQQNPFDGFDSKGIKNATNTIKQLQTAVKGVNSEVRDVNDEFDNTFRSLQMRYLNRVLFVVSSLSDKVKT